MDTGQIEHHGERGVARAKHRVLHLKPAGFHVYRPHLSLFRETVGNHALRDLRNDGAGVLIVIAEHRDAVERQPFDKHREGLLQTLEIVPVGVHVVLVNIRDDREHRRKIEERGVRLVRFRDEVLTGSEAGVRAGLHQLAADHKCRIKAARRNQRRRKRRRRSLAVRAGNRDALSEAHQFREHHGARNDRDMLGAGFHHFGVLFMNRGGNHNRVGSGGVRRVVAKPDRRAHLSKMPRRIAFSDIRPGHVIAEIHHHFGNAAHANTADTDEMHVLNNKFPGHQDTLKVRSARDSIISATAEAALE